MARGDVQRVRAFGRGPFRDLQRVGELEPVRKIIVARSGEKSPGSPAARL